MSFVCWNRPGCRLLLLCDFCHATVRCCTTQVLVRALSTRLVENSSRSQNNDDERQKRTSAHHHREGRIPADESDTACSGHDDTWKNRSGVQMRRRRRGEIREIRCWPCGGSQDCPWNLGICAVTGPFDRLLLTCALRVAGRSLRCSRRRVVEAFDQECCWPPLPLGWEG